MVHFVHCPGLHCCRQVRLADIESVAVEERRGYLTLVITAPRDLKLLLRRTEGIREWAASLEVHWRRVITHQHLVMLQTAVNWTLWRMMMRYLISSYNHDKIMIR